MEIIDFHTQPLPYDLSGLLPEKGKVWARLATQPLSSALHETTPFLRFLPPLGRQLLGGLAERLAPAPFLLLESSVQDLKTAMENSNVERAVVVAEPPRIANEFVLDLAAHDSKFIACVQLRAEDPIEKLAEWKNQGARVVKITDRGASHHAQTVRIAQEAARLALPVLLKCSSASRVLELVEATKGTPTLIFQMNHDDPEIAIELAEKFDHVYLETSGQPVELLAEGVRRVGADRVVFGSDWPWMGNNMRIGIRRVQEGIEDQLFSEEDAKLILGLNALRILEGRGERKS